MRQGFRVIDSDTHVNPSLDVLLRYADQELAERIDDLQPYRRTGQDGGRPGRRRGRGLLHDPVGQSPFACSGWPVRRRRRRRRATAIAAFSRGARRWSRASPSRRGSPRTTPLGRLRDMDLEGRDIDFIIPGPWAYGAPALAPHLAHGLYRAYHRYMAEYCAADSRRLKSMILALATDPAWSAQVIKERAREDWWRRCGRCSPRGCPSTIPISSPSGRPPTRPICRSCTTRSPSRRRTSRAIAISGTTRRWAAAPARPGAASAFSPSC